LGQFVRSEAPLSALLSERRVPGRGGLEVWPSTTAVAADDAVAEPAELLAVTETRIVDPTSADARR
jgi:hypothetical protein